MTTKDNTLPTTQTTPTRSTRKRAVKPTTDEAKAKTTEVTDMPLHPFCELFPQADEQTLEALTEDIRKNGLLSPITTYRGNTIDGQNRGICCKRAGVEPRYEEYTGDPDNLFDYILSKNINRRQLTTSQRAIIGAKMSSGKIGGEEAQICAFTQEQAADAMNVSRRLVQDAAKLLRDAPPELVEEVARDEKTVHAALQEIKPATDTSSEQSEGDAEPKPEKQEDADAQSSDKVESAKKATAKPKPATPADPVLVKAQEVLKPMPADDDELFDAYTDIVIEMYDVGLKDDDSRDLFRRWLKEEIVEADDDAADAA